jgi:hypothetical protein
MKKRDIFISLAIIGAAFLTVWACLQAKGYVRIDAGGASAELQLRNAWFTARTITSGEQAAEVGARVYNARRLSILQKLNGHDWRIEGVYGPWGGLSRIKVRRSQTTELRLGPPFVVKPGVSRSGSVVSVGYTVIGQAGEHYRSFATTDGRIAMPGAKVKILDEAGNVLETGQFSYG